MDYEARQLGVNITSAVGVYAINKLLAKSNVHPLAKLGLQLVMIQVIHLLARRVFPSDGQGELSEWLSARLAPRS